VLHLLSALAVDIESPLEVWRTHQGERLEYQVNFDAAAVEIVRRKRDFFTDERIWLDASFGSVSIGVVYGDGLRPWDDHPNPAIRAFGPGGIMTLMIRFPELPWLLDEPMPPERADPKAERE
jgi:hypothetical protein